MHTPAYSLLSMLSPCCDGVRRGLQASDATTKQTLTTQKTYLDPEALPKNYSETGKRMIRTISLTREQELGYMKVLCVLEFHQL